MEVPVVEVLGILEVIEKPSGSGDENVDALPQPIGLSLPVGSPDDETVGLLVLTGVANVPENSVNLKTELAGGGDYDGTGSVPSAPLDLVKELEGRDEEGEGLGLEGGGGGGGGEERSDEQKIVSYCAVVV